MGPSSSRLTGWVLLAAAVVLAGHFAWYGATPFGLAPVLDGRELLLLARAMAAGTLPPEPFYRAPLYPAALAGCMQCGLDPAWLPWAARLLNAAGIFLAAGCAARLAGRWWDSPGSAALAAGLVGFYPVLHFFAADPTDIVWAAALLMAALTAACSAKPLSSGRIMAVGGLLGLGSLVRSHLLPVAFAWPVWVLWREREARWRAGLAAAGPALALAAFGFANLALAGEFRLTPWQGAYNFWTGNGPHANGRYFAQTVRVSFDTGYDNPAKLESIRLYEQETGRRPPHSIAGMNRYWTQKTLRHLAAHPRAWLRLMARKTGALLNDHEQYDNKTYAFQKSLAPWLRWNPLGWGVLLALAAPGWLALRGREPRAAALLAVFLAVYAAGVVLFHTNNRFRVPLVPPLAVLAAGAPVWLRARGRALGAVLAAAALAAGAAFFPLGGLAQDATVAQDCGLLAMAAQNVGRDAEARAWAGRGLSLQPGREDLRELVVLADFNLLIASGAPPLTRAAAEARLAACETFRSPSPQVAYARGVYLWKLGRPADAEAAWALLARDSHSPARTSALAALLFTGGRSSPWFQPAVGTVAAVRSPLLNFVLAGLGDPSASRWLEMHMNTHDQALLLAGLRTLFAPVADHARYPDRR